MLQLCASITRLEHHPQESESGLTVKQGYPRAALEAAFPLHLLLSMGVLFMRNTNPLSLPRSLKGHSKKAVRFPARTDCLGVVCSDFFVPLFTSRGLARQRLNAMLSPHGRERQTKLVPSPFRASPARLPDPPPTHCKLSPWLFPSHPWCQGWQCHPPVCTSQQDNCFSETC